VRSGEGERERERERERSGREGRRGWLLVLSLSLPLASLFFFFTLPPLLLFHSLLSCPLIPSCLQNPSQGPVPLCRNSLPLNLSHQLPPRSHSPAVCVGADCLRFSLS
jgi:hypothetical protein